jgi:branched-chain amino acid transport system ATP-binding protein
MTELLEVDDLSMRFGGLTAVDGLSFKARAGEITAIIGPNGAGKTTVFNCLTGFYRPSAGQIRLSRAGKIYRLDRMHGYATARAAKVVRTFQNVRLFAGMSVLENLLVAQHVALMRASLFSVAGLLNLARHRKAERAGVEKALYWLEKVGLADVANDAAGGLPYGSQRRLEIARAMCAGPVLLCVDEPAAGLNPHESRELGKMLLDIRREQGVAILLIEHDMSVVMHISDRIIVLDHGACIADGTPAEVRSNPAVIRAYLGASDAA